MSILFSAATVGQVKSLAKRVQALLPTELGIAPIPLSRAQDIAARLLGHADFHAAQTYPRLKFRLPWQRERLPLPLRMPASTRAPIPQVSLGETFLLLDPASQSGPDAHGMTESAFVAGVLVKEADGSIRFNVRPREELGFVTVFAGCDFPSFKKNEVTMAPPTLEVTEAEVQATMDNCNVQIPMKNEVATQEELADRDYAGRAHIIYKSKIYMSQILGPDGRSHRFPSPADILADGENAKDPVRPEKGTPHQTPDGARWNDKADSVLSVEKEHHEPASQSMTVQSGQTGYGRTVISADQLFQAVKDAEAEAERRRQLDPKP